MQGEKQTQYRAGARRAAVAHSGYIMENGKIVIDGTAERLANDPDVREFYLGMGGGGEAKSFKDIKHYKRRKRWLS